MPSQSRSYRILGLIGVGGFGKVYRARMLGSSGFSKDVAIKVLHDANPDEDLLKRFRDEARILGLIRDRAIVSVDPPTRLGDHWAVVMDFVDGVSCSALLKNHRQLPPGVVAEIIGEIARVLHKAYHFERPDGGMLELLHRDIKPGNIQVTPGGEVRLLDFGAARATFNAREALTVDGICGTPGYMAPERFSGIEEPAGDMYSLGVLMWVMITGESPGKRGPIDLRDAASEFSGEACTALKLAAEMRMPDHRDRPCARDVERSCRDMLRTFDEPYLREWAEENVPAVSRSAEDVLVGGVLSDTLYHEHDLHGALTVVVDPPSEELTGRSRRALWLGTALTLSTAMVTGLGAAVVLSVGVAMLWWWEGDPPPMPPQEVEFSESENPVEQVAVPEEDAEMEDIVVDADAEVDAEDIVVDAVEEREDVEEPVEPEPVIVAAPVPMRPPRAAPRPRRPEPVVEPVPPQEPGPTTYPQAFRSIPWGAAVFIDGKQVGATPLNGVELPKGDHQLRLTVGGHSLNKRIHVGKRSPNDYQWIVETGEWSAGFRSRR